MRTPNVFIKRVKGTDYYVARWTEDGKRKDRSLGRVDSMSPSQAKLAALRLVDEHDEPRSKAPTFGAILDEAMKDIARVKQWKNGRSERQWRQSLNDYALPALAERPVDQITADDIRKALVPIWTQKTETASRVRMRIEAVLDWCTVKKLRSGPNPATWKGNLALLLPAKGKVSPVKHQEAPTIEELQKAVAYCKAHRSPASGLFLFTAATVVRNTEARFLMLEEIEGDVWTVPTARMKTEQETPFRVPLSSLAKYALEWAEPEGYAFTANGSPLSIDTVRLKMNDIIGRRVTLHGVRSAFRDWAAREGIDHAVAEKCLSHVWGNQTTQAYFRDDLLEQRREVMERWACALCG